MAQLLFDFRTNYNRAEISHVDINVKHRNDSRFHRFEIIYPIRDGDLERGIRLTTFRDLNDGEDIYIVARLFLNSGTSINIELNSAIYRLAPRVRYGIFNLRSRESINAYTMVVSRP